MNGTVIQMPNIIVRMGTRIHFRNCLVMPCLKSVQDCSLNVYRNENTNIVGNLCKYASNDCLVDAEEFRDYLNRSSNERNMTRKTRTRQPRIHSDFQSGYCAVCHIPYNNLEEHIQSKRHTRLIGDDDHYISLNGFIDDQDPFLNLKLDVKSDAAVLQVNKKMPRTRSASICDRVKDDSMSPGSDSGHHLRSRKNINYMTPPLEEDSLTEKPEVVKEYRELRSSTRLLAKLTDQIVESDEVWNSGRPKRSCNKQRFSADERLVVDNKSYYKVEVLPTKLRSGGHGFNNYQTKRHETQLKGNDGKDDDKGLIVKFRKLRNSELVQLNNEAENFLFPKKDDCTRDDGNIDCNGPNTTFSTTKNDSLLLSSDDDSKNIKIEDDESQNSLSSDCKTKKRRRTHAEAFIRDNQKYYKFETPGSRLRYQGSYLPSVASVTNKKINGDCTGRQQEHVHHSQKNFKLNLDEYNFSFEKVPQREYWYETFKRRDTGKEKYLYFSDYSYWDPFLLPYQVGNLPPLDPHECITQYTQIKKCFTEPPSSASTSATCSTPDPINSNSTSSVDTQSVQDEDSKISATMTEVSSVSTLDEIKPRKRGPKPRASHGRNPRKSPRQHASTLAILSSLLQQRKRKSRSPNKNLPTIDEEPNQKLSKKNGDSKIDYFLIARNIEEEFAKSCEVDLLGEVEMVTDGIAFTKSKIDVVDLLNVYDQNVLELNSNRVKKVRSRGKAGRKPGKKKKNRTGWPNRNRRIRKVVHRHHHHHHKDDLNDRMIDGRSVNSVMCEENSTDSINKTVVKPSENNNKHVDDGSDNLDCDHNSDRVVNDMNSDEKVLTNKVNNGSSEPLNDIQLQPYVRVQKLAKDQTGVKAKKRRNTSPKRTNRGQRRMPASPKSPRMLRRPRGRWYRER